MSAAGGYSRAAKLRKPAETRFDRFAIFQVAREYGLGPLDCWMLVALVLLCDWRDGVWAGTITELAENVRGDRRAVRRAIDRLAEHDLVQVVSDFGSGPMVQGELRLMVYDRLVTDGKPVGRAEPSTKPEPHIRPFRNPNRADPRGSVSANRAGTARQPRVNRAASAQNGAIAPAPTCDDAPTQGSNGGKGQGKTDEPRDDTQAIGQLQRTLGGELVE